MNSILNWIVAKLTSDRAGDHVLTRCIAVILLVVSILFCLFKDPGAHNTIIVTLGSLVGGLCGVHSIASYFGNSNSAD